MRIKIILTLLLLIFLVSQFSITAKAYDGSEETSLKVWLEEVFSNGQNKFSANAFTIDDQILRFYQQVGYRLVWIDSRGLSSYGNMLIRTLEYTSQDGFIMKETLPTVSQPLVGNVSVQTSDDPYEREAYIRWDVWLTAKALEYSHQVWKGRVDPERLTKNWLATRRPMDRDIPTELAKAVSGNQLSPFFMSLHPKREEYVALREALQRYKAIKQNGSWQPIEAGTTLRMGDRGPRVKMLKQRLEKTGDLIDAAASDDDIFDAKVEDAVKKFQHRHGLKTDGFVGKRTLSALNLSVEKRITCLKLNMERWRWFPDNFGERYILVNIPAFELHVVDGNKRIDTLRVIVGKRYRKTPIMSEQMTYLEFNPYWNIPRKIARKDILPQVRKDPLYLTRKGIRVFDGWDQHANELAPSNIPWESFAQNHFPYRLRQDPSSVNALGQIKFMFPNPHSIYIHDTPSKTLFNHHERAFSSGVCTGRNA